MQSHRKLPAPVTRVVRGARVRYGAVPHGKENIYGEYTALYTSARWGCADGLRLLLAGGAVPNALGRRGCTALHQAVFSGGGDAVMLLLQHGADVHPQDRHGYSALSSAREVGDDAIFLDLLESAAVGVAIDGRPN